MEEDIKNMSKEELLEYLEDISQQLDNIALDQIQFAISELQFFKEEYKKLEEENKQLKTRRIIGSIYDVKIEDLKDVLSPYYIPKSVIKEKIDKKQKQLELLKKELQGRQTNFVNKNIITGQIQVLQELLDLKE